MREHWPQAPHLLALSHPGILRSKTWKVHVISQPWQLLGKWFASWVLPYKKKTWLAITALVTNFFLWTWTNLVTARVIQHHCQHHWRALRHSSGDVGAKLPWYCRVSPWTAQRMCLLAGLGFHGTDSQQTQLPARWWWGGEGDGCHQSSYMTSYSKEMSGGLCDSHVNSTITKLCPQSKSGEKWSMWTVGYMTAVKVCPWHNGWEKQLKRAEC